MQQADIMEDKDQLLEQNQKLEFANSKLERMLQELQAQRDQLEQEKREADQNTVSPMLSSLQLNGVSEAYPGGVLRVLEHPP